MLTRHSGSLRSYFLLVFSAFQPAWGHSPLWISSLSVLHHSAVHRYRPIFFTLTWPGFPSLVIFGYMTCLCDCGWEREREHQWRTGSFFSSVSLSCCLFFPPLLLTLERHSLPSPPKEPHVFGQSGGVMHECMPCLLLARDEFIQCFAIIVLISIVHCHLDFQLAIIYNQWHL